ncbi:MAG: hypothetical protein FJ190_08700 [Gammaproteobacteria bacterium]|nr:hypothetical protein [Gammaproteobacteria bacterium]
MLLTCSRYLALVFAIGLGIGETAMNWGYWQYAPLWIVDYMIVGWLLLGYYQTRAGQNINTLLTAWAFTAGVFYIALFVSLDPELKPYINADTVILALMALLLMLSVIGLFTAFKALKL